MGISVILESVALTVATGGIALVGAIGVGIMTAILGVTLSTPKDYKKKEKYTMEFCHEQVKDEYLK